jgi:hypothetical protein
MRKNILMVVLGVSITMSGCYHRLCPTYTKNPDKIEKTNRTIVKQPKIKVKKNV